MEALHDRGTDRLLTDLGVKPQGGAVPTGWERVKTSTETAPKPWRTCRDWAACRTRKLVAHPRPDGDTLRDRLKYSDRLARFSARVGINGVSGASEYPPSVWMIDPLRGQRGRALRLRLLRMRGDMTGVPSCLYRVRNVNPHK
jgi:hypothetical protein